MQGIIIANSGLKTNKFLEIYSMLIESFKKRDVQLNIIYNDEILLNLGVLNLNANFILFYDKDIKLCKFLENSGYLVFNSSRAIEICDDKALMCLELSKYNINMPKQVISPKIFFGKLQDEYLRLVIDYLKLPIVIKCAKGSFGNEIFLAKTAQDFFEKVKNLQECELVFQEFISSSFGVDIRIQTVGGKMVAYAKRMAKDGDFRSNVTSGGSMIKIDNLDQKYINLAENVSKILNLDFAGVDLLIGENPYLLEVNSNAHFKNLYNCTGVNTADYIADYVIKKVENK